MAKLQGEVCLGGSVHPEEFVTLDYDSSYNCDEYDCDVVHRCIEYANIQVLEVNADIMVEKLLNRASEVVNNVSAVPLRGKTRRMVGINLDTPELRNQLKTQLQVLKDTNGFNVFEREAYEGFTVRGYYGEEIYVDFSDPTVEKAVVETTRRVALSALDAGNVAKYLNVS